ncbi:hypothetical protein FY034_17830 (plasmid) [Trichlorobacter lovleyi]|uniref:hypothetical protein n=1 Tax=Trichlorobacter lovleyi TaxID=313985 RepID=UPI0022403704|nr:hypothetical protein [Trichlorobacter lovleyi]QOX80882.1 hypothetical protein FY034_17830 [Trichlorobacter lovleyi]
MYKKLVHLLIVVIFVLVGMSAARADGGKVLYVGNEKGVCEKISPFVDVCREREDLQIDDPSLPKDPMERMVAYGAMRLRKYASYTKDAKDFSVVIEEAYLTKRNFNPAGLLASVAAITVGGGFGQGTMIGNKNPFGSSEYSGGVPGFEVKVDGDRKEEACGEESYPECRARMLELVKQRWPKKVQ